MPRTLRAPANMSSCCLLTLLLCCLLLTDALYLQNAVTPFDNVQQQPQGQQQEAICVAMKRARRQVLDFKETDVAPDTDYDLELAEINVFRPLFRYRVARVQNQ